MKCCDVNSGMLNTLISIERSTKTSDGAGGFTEQWVRVSSSAKRAFVKSFSGREQWASERVEARTVLRIVCRYNSNVLQTDRVAIRGKRYDIVAINNVEFMDSWLEIDLAGGVPT
jgi:SPP1 family predicted phage head-tail adaptor